MQPLLRPLLNCFGIRQTGASKRSDKGHKSTWAGRLLENEARNAPANPAPSGFHRLGDPERLPGKDYPSSLSDGISTGAGNSTFVDHSSWTDDGGGLDRDAVPLNKIYVDKDIIVSRA